MTIVNDDREAFTECLGTKCQQNQSINHVCERPLFCLTISLAYLCSWNRSATSDDVGPLSTSYAVVLLAIEHCTTLTLHIIVYFFS